MDVCPVCETPNRSAALECPTCGHIFRPAAVDASIVPLADFEATFSATAAVSIEVTPGLEQTRFEMAAPPSAAPLEGLEPTLAGPQTVANEITPDLEPTRLAEEELPSIYPVDVTCANCGEVAAEEQAFCNRCGMQLPRTRVATAAPDPSAQACTSCGGSSFGGGVCRRCGARQPAAP